MQLRKQKFSSSTKIPSLEQNRNNKCKWIVMQTGISMYKAGVPLSTWTTIIHAQILTKKSKGVAVISDSS